MSETSLTSPFDRVYLTKPPIGTGVQLSRVYPNSLPFNVWVNGHIVQFCPDIKLAFEHLREVLVVSLDKEGNDKERFNFYVTDQGSIRQINMSQLVPRTEEKDG